MSAGHANTIREDALPTLLERVTAKADKPEVMRSAFMLSYYAGLRVQEIAGLEWDKHIMQEGNLRMSPAPVYDETGRPRRLKKTGEIMTRLSPTLYISGDIGKYGTERHIPMHPQLSTALLSLYQTRDTGTPFVIPSGRKGAGQSLRKRAHALKMRINRMYAAMGMDGYSSHSGRRTFITLGAQKANAFDNSLRDVQVMAGHKSLMTTQRYIDISPRQADLVAGMYTERPFSGMSND